MPNAVASVAEVRPRAVLAGAGTVDWGFGRSQWPDVRGAFIVWLLLALVRRIARRVGTSEEMAMGRVGPREFKVGVDDEEPPARRLSGPELKGLVDELRICARDVSAIGDMDTCGKLRRIAYRLERGLLS